MGKIRRFAEITGLLSHVFGGTSEEVSSYNDALKMHLQKYMAQKKQASPQPSTKLNAMGPLKKFMRDFPENREKSPARLHRLLSANISRA